MRPDVPTPAIPTHRGAGPRGQVILMFAFVMIAVLAMAALLIDGGLAWSNRRAAQNAADTAALAAALAKGQGQDMNTAADLLAGQNGFDPNLVDCDGASLPGEGVVVNNPPLGGLHTMALDPTNADAYVEVIVTRAMQTTFARAIGMPCWLVAARAVAAIPQFSAAGCSFCSLNNSDKNHTLVLKNGATLRVDGDIYVNSSNGAYTPGSCSPLTDWFVCGDGFDIFGTGGLITARTISVNGGWETHDDNPTQADFLVAGCVDTFTPPSQTAPYIPSRVCIHMPQIADPLNDPVNPGNVIDPPVAASPPVAGDSGCPTVAEGAQIPTGTQGSPSTLTIAGNGSWTICPGTYYGGVQILGTASVTMVSGVYYMAGGGFSVTGDASLDGTAGVMIYNSSGTISGVSTTPATVDTVPAKIPGKKDPKLNNGLTSDNNPSDLGETVNYTMTLDRSGGSPSPTGTVSFYDGAIPAGLPGAGQPDPIAACQNLPLVSAGGTKVKATCANQVYNSFGTRAILAIYWGDSVYNAIGDTLTQTINSGGNIAPVTLQTNGNIQIKGPSSGKYAGLAIFQDRTSNLTITLRPGSGLAACTGAWLTQDVPDAPGTEPPAACGALGGIQGTVYAANQTALVFVTASGLANLQVIAGKIQIDSGADARFAYTPQFFANGVIRLIE